MRKKCLLNHKILPKGKESLNLKKPGKVPPYKAEKITVFSISLFLTLS